MMYWHDHSPPHFHVRYGEHEIEMNIRDGLIRGTMPRRALAMVQAWRKTHLAELLANWEFAQAGEPLAGIRPLE